MIDLTRTYDTARGRRGSAKSWIGLEIRLEQHKHSVRGVTAAYIGDYNPVPDYVSLIMHVFC